MVGLPVVRPSSDALHMPDDTELLAISFDGVSVKTVRLDHVGAGATSQTFTVPADSGIVDIPGDLRLVDLDAISVSKPTDPAAKGTMTLHCEYLGRRFVLPAIPVELGVGTAFEKVASFTTDQVDRRRELLTHLQGQREYYSQAIFGALDSATLTVVLGGYQWRGKPLIDQVEPRPVTVAGNYLVLRAPVDAVEDSGVVRDGDAVSWGQLLEDRGLPLRGALDERLIPMATGGVFAEAVLGRSNAAEKLDITRFWHWEDSPIPLVPTEIAPVATGSRATAENLTPGQLSPPLLNIVNPTSLPDPAGLGAAFSALANLNFRDMSGLAGTQALVKAAMEGTLAGAADAGRLASENMKTEAQKAVAMGQIAADVAKTAIAASVSGKAKDSKAAMGGVSRDGALLNHARKMDQESPGKGGASRPSSAAPGSNTGSNGSSGGDGGGGGGGGFSGVLSGGGPGSGETSREDTVLDATTFGPLAQPVGSVIRDVLGAAATAATPGSGGSTGTTGSIDLQVGKVRFLPQNFVYAHVERVGDLATFAQEIDALRSGTWHPASPDFRAIAIRSNGMKPIPAAAEVSSFESFFRRVTLGLTNNFFGYFMPNTQNPGIQLTSTVSQGSLLATGDVLDLETIEDFKQRIQSPDDGLTALLQVISEQNAASDITKSLYLYLCAASDPVTWPTRLIAQALGELLNMTVYYLDAPIWYRPLLQSEPQLDEKRGRISLSTAQSPPGEIVESVSRLDFDLQEA